MASAEVLLASPNSPSRPMRTGGKWSDIAADGNATKRYTMNSLTIQLNIPNALRA